MEEKIIEMAEHLIRIRKLKEELHDEKYWIQKASQETDFVPAEGDWIYVEVSLFKIEVSVYHKDYGEAKYWKNGVWRQTPFGSDYPLPEELLTEKH